MKEVCQAMARLRSMNVLRLIK